MILGPISMVRVLSSINQLIVNKFLDNFAQHNFYVRNTNDFPKSLFQLHY